LRLRPPHPWRRLINQLGSRPPSFAVRVGGELVD
jgi:hypothetical protein